MKARGLAVLRPCKRSFRHPRLARGSAPRVCAGIVPLALLASSALLLGVRAGPRPISLRIEGYFDTSPSEVRATREVTAQVGRATTRRLAVTGIVNLGAGPLGMAILDEVARHRPSLRFTGDRALVSRLADAAPGERVEITGHLTEGRYFMVSAVRVEPPRAPSGTPAGAPGSPPAMTPGAGLAPTPAASRAPDLPR